MLFNSLGYALFLPTVFAIHWLLPHRGRVWFLVSASYVFYGWWDARFLSLIIISTLVDFVVAKRIDATTIERRRRFLLATSIAANIGILGFFKYSGFFVESAADLLVSFGLEANLPFLRVVLPVGISFYTFQTISYTFDVFRRRIPATSDLLSFALYVAYFPQLVAGPIERARHLLPQVQALRSFPKADKIASGVALIGLGLFKKVAIADVMAPIVNVAFADPASQSSLQLLVGVYAFALQIYGDFSGYTDIARGTSRLFGIELMRNFEQPYLSRNITEFWRTWHVSLSNWLHDYLYIPLGGNRRGRARTYLNLMIVMILGGLWHGAAWTFVVWGALHGVFLAVHRMTGHYSPRGYQGGFSFKTDGIRALITFNFVGLAWIFFRADTIEAAWAYLTGLFAFQPGLPPTSWMMLLLPAMALVLLFDVGQRNADDHDVVVSWRPAAQGLAYATFVLGILIFSGGPSIPFIYFQF
jgi:alginate O-acetyltransferase complex protein AlgI